MQLEWSKPSCLLDSLSLVIFIPTSLTWQAKTICTHRVLQAQPHPLSLTTKTMTVPQGVLKQTFLHPDTFPVTHQTASKHWKTLNSFQLSLIVLTWLQQFFFVFTKICVVFLTSITCWSFSVYCTKVVILCRIVCSKHVKLLVKILRYFYFKIIIWDCFVNIWPICIFTMSAEYSD